MFGVVLVFETAAMIDDITVGAVGGLRFGAALVDEVILGSGFDTGVSAVVMI